MFKLISVPVRETLISEMTTEEFLRLLQKKHVQIQAREGRLKINAPAGAVDASLRVELKQRKASLLAALGRTMVKAGPYPAMLPLSASVSQVRTPLTPAQQGMWLIDHFNPENAAYNIPDAFLLDHPMELDTMQAAVDDLVERHSILRTSFHEEGGELFQSIAAKVDAQVGVTDLSSLPGADGERRCREAINDQMRQAFDMTQAPLVRFHLFRLADRRHVFFFNIHHIIADRTSLYVLREELVALAGAIESGRDAILPAIQLQFADYAAWVAEQMRSDRIEGQIAYWKRKLQGVPAFVELPHSRPRPEAPSSSGAAKRIFVPDVARAALGRIGTEEGASPFMTFLAVFAVSVARWSQPRQAGPVDFCIGSPMTHRKEAATERMIGPFVNMLAFRCQIGPGMSFREVLRQVRGTAIEAYENSDLPFQRLVHATNPDRRSRRSPIFQVMFGYERYMAPAANEFHLEADSGTARYDLSLHLWETADGGLSGNIEYSTDLFEDADIDKLGAEGDAIFAEIARDADQDVFPAGLPARALEIPSASSGGDELVGSGLVAKGGLPSRIARMLSMITTAKSKHREVKSIAVKD